MTKWNVQKSWNNKIQNHNSLALPSINPQNMNVMKCGFEDCLIVDYRKFPKAPLYILYISNREYKIKTGNKL